MTSINDPTNRVPNQSLLDAGLSLMRTAGQPLERLQTGTRSMRYRLSSGETVRVRTCNDHVLVVLADSPDPGASLNIEGTDHLLVVMPEVPRQSGAVIAYFIPAAVAAQDVRRAHSDWLATKPFTKGNNRTWNIWFGDGPATCAGFASKWAQYRVGGHVSVQEGKPVPRIPQADRPLGTVIAQAREDIAKAAGVPVEAVKITVVLD